VKQRESHLLLRRDIDEFRVFLEMLRMGEKMDHLAKRFVALGWVVQDSAEPLGYALTPSGTRALDY
jgi:hypothetical protein